MTDNDFIWRFTPSRTEPEILEAIFVQREPLLADIVERIRESATTGNKHQVLLIGPRGIGKTHLIALMHHRVTQDPALSDRVRIAWFLEDETITSFVQLLKRIYELLAEEYPAEFPRAWLENLLDHPPAKILKALEKELIVKFGDRTLLLFIENLDLIFKGLGDEGQKQWRAFLQTHPFTIVVATSQRLFNGVRNREQPFFGFFAAKHLEPLNTPDAVALLGRIARQRKQEDLVAFLATPEGRSRVRALHHLAGGNHRIYIVLSGFITRESLDELTGPFEKMADELTPYYQERMRWLSAQQRQIVEFLCSREEACTPKEIARHLLTGENTISGQLKKLMDLGYLLRNPRGRESLYELAEPLMRLASEVKEKRRRPLRLLVNFLRIWYRPEILPQLLSRASTPSLRAHLQAAISHSRSSPDPRLKVLEMEIEEARQENRIEDLLKVLEERVHTRGSITDWFDLAVYHDELNQFEAAIEGYTKTIELDPQYAFAWSCKGSMLRELKRYNEAIECFNKSLEIDPRDTFSWNIKGSTLHDSNQHEAAVQCYNTSLEIDPENAFTWFIKGNAFHDLGRRESAVECYDMVLGIAPKHAAAWNNKGSALHNQGEYETAVACFDKALDINPKYAAAWNNKGNAVHELDRHEAAVQCYSKALDIDPQYAFACYCMGNALHDLGQHEAAIQSYNRALQVDPQNVFALYNKGSALNDLDRYEAAVECYNEALRITPQSAITWFFKGSAHYNLHRYQVAIECYDKALEIDPQYAFIWLFKGNSLKNTGQHKVAIRCYDKALEIDPLYVFAWYRKGHALQELGYHENAVACFDKVIEIDPKDTTAWHNKGYLYSEIFRHEEAFKCFANALTLDAGHAFTLNYMGYTLGRLERHTEAHHYYEKALEINSNSPEWIFDRCEPRFALRRWDAGFSSLEEAFEQSPHDTGHDVKAFIDLILTHSEGHEELRSHTATLIAIYHKAGVVTYLGDGLVRSLRRIDPRRRIDRKLLEDWRDSWLELGGGVEELEIPLRIFRVGIEYLIGGDEKALLDLVTVERSILRQRLGLDPVDGAE